MTTLLMILGSIAFVFIFALIVWYTAYVLNIVLDNYYFDFATFKTFKKQYLKNILLAESNNNYLVTKGNVIMTTSLEHSVWNDGMYIYLSDDEIRFYGDSYMILDIFSYYRYLIWRYSCAHNSCRVKGLFKD